MGYTRAARRVLIHVGQNHGMSTAGAALAPHIVPASTPALYYSRAPDVESRQQLEIRVRACSEAGASAIGCAHEVTRVTPLHIDLVLLIGGVCRRLVAPVITAGGAV